jgi:hypothetical protein
VDSGVEGDVVTWAAVDELAKAGDLDGIVGLLVRAGEADRFAAGSAIEAGVLSAEAGPWWAAGPVGGRAPANPAPGHALAVIGCVRGAAKAATLLAKLSGRTSNHSYLERIVEVGRSREPSWLADVGTRIAGRLPARDARFEDWGLAAALLREASAGPPVTEAFVRCWIRQLMRPGLPGQEVKSLAARLGEDSFLDRLLPAFFEIEGLGTDAAMSFRDPGVEHEDREPWLPATVPVLLEQGRLDRAVILDATVGRLGYGGRAAGLRAFVLLHDTLMLTIDELTARVADYIRMLPDGASTVAGLAQRALRTVDEAGRLELEILLEASGPVLVRSEKSLVKAQLIWLARVAGRHRDRIDEIMEVVAAAFGNPDAEIQQRALGLVTRHIGALSPATVDRLAEAATQLTGDLADRAAVLLSTVEPGTTEPSGATTGASADTPKAERNTGTTAKTASATTSEPKTGTTTKTGSATTGEPNTGTTTKTGSATTGEPNTGPCSGTTGKSGSGTIGGPGSGVVDGPGAGAASVAARMPPPIADVVELAGEVASLLVAETAVGWERVLAGLVALCSAGRRRELAGLLSPFLERYPYEFEHLIWVAQKRTVFLGVVIRRLGDPDDPGPAWDRMVEAVRTAEDTGQRGGPDSALAKTPDGVLAARIGEVAMRFLDQPVPLLMATPTHVSGSLDAEVLLQRLRRAEVEGWQPWRFDLEQALLRVPRRVDPTVVAAAGRLTSPAGRLFAGWLSDGGLPDPVSVRVEQRPGGFHPTRVDPATTPAERVVADLRPPRAGRLSLETQLLTVTRDPLPFRVGREPGGDNVGLAMVLPHHRDAIAAWVLPDVAGGVEERGGGSRMSLLADCTGPAGVATVLTLAYGLTARHEPDRAAAVDLFLALAAEGGSLTGQGGSLTNQDGSFTDQGGSLTNQDGSLIDQGGSFAAAVGAELGRLGGPDGLVKVSRSVPALADAHRAGATGHVWEVLGAALPQLLPAAPRGLPDMLSLATEVAHAAGAHGAIAGLAAVAGRRGSSRLVAEARRLDKVLTA